MGYRRWPRVARPTLVVVLAGVAVTVALFVAARAAHDDNEDRLLEQRTQEAAAVLSASIPGVEASLAQVAVLANAVSDEQTPAVREVVEGQLQQRFVAMSVWRTGADRPLVESGETKVDVDAGRVEGWIAGAPGQDEPRLRVLDLLDLPDPRIGYVYTLPGPAPVVVYAEQPTSPERRTEVDRGEPFEDLDFALYLGRGDDVDSLIFASTEDLKVEGRTSSSEIPYGDSVLRLVMSPMQQLGGRLLARLPWLVGGGGLAVTAVAAALVESLHRRRRDAEQLAATVEELYGREHAIAHTLQHSLLPQTLPDVPGTEIAVRYVAGALGTEVGGDWYDVIALGGGRVTLVVGDVAGKGVKAAAVMAAMRYGTHAIAAQDVTPARVLSRINGLERIRGDFVTMVCAVLDVRSRSVSWSRAGHPPPLVVAGEDTYFLEGHIGPPVGFVAGADYETDEETVPAGATLLLYTDGLYERPGEDLDVGLERLRTVASRFDGPVEALVDHVRTQMIGDQGRDDVALLAVRLDL